MKFCNIYSISKDVPLVKRERELGKQKTRVELQIVQIIVNARKTKLKTPVLVEDKVVTTIENTGIGIKNPEGATHTKAKQKINNIL